MNNDRYRTLAGEGHAQLREKASRFIAYAFPIRDEEEVKQRVDELARKHHDSRHVCYAWVLGADGERHRANDAGEPSGTAGRPILNRIQGAGLTHCAVVVVRYFGGTLLGKAGLVKAYGESAAMALAEAPVKEMVVCAQVHIRCTHAQLQAVRNTIAKLGGEVFDAQYDTHCTLVAGLPRSTVDAQVQAWSLAGITARRDPA